ncbi:hypothetical protein BCR33DRAFT_642746, partial [Rhizoclosmatium globosum]
DAVRKMTEGKRGDWYRFFSMALWSIRVTINRATGYSPYELCFGQEPVLPMEFLIESFAVIEWRDMTTQELLEARFRILERKPEDLQLARERIERAREQRANQFNREHRLRPDSESIEEGDMVIVRDSKLDTIAGGKLRWRYFGPFWVFAKGESGYWLTEMDGTRIRKPFQGSRVKLY